MQCGKACRQLQKELITLLQSVLRMYFGNTVTDTETHFCLYIKVGLKQM